MIEKTFDKAYKVGTRGVSQVALTRAANRLISEYKAVFGGWEIPEEIKEISEKIKLPYTFSSFYRISRKNPPNRRVSRCETEKTVLY